MKNKSNKKTDREEIEDIFKEANKKIFVPRGSYYPDEDAFKLADRDE